MSKRNLYLVSALGFVLSPAPRLPRELNAQTSIPETTVSAVPVELPVPTDNPTTPDKVALGKQLFFDPRLSGNNKVSCASCHVPAKAFADGLPTAKGVGGRSLARNTLSLLNVAFYTSYFWDGRAGSLEEQALAPVRAADEMNQDLDELIRELSGVTAYVEQFQSAFGTKVDRFLAGDKSALSEQAREGWQLFRDAGCIRCHNGPALSDNKFYRLGIDYRDPGRGAVTGEKRDFYLFRTPGLRDVARTAPYMHDGSLGTLEEVVQFYYRSTPARAPEALTLDFEPLIGRSFSEIAPIVAFLESLTGEAAEISPPQLP